MKILYVEDNPTDADLARHALTGASPHEVEIAPTVAAALVRLKKPDDLDLVLCDLGLPDGSGLDVLDYIRTHKMPLAVVMLTGAGDQEAAAKALKTGADDYVAKRGDYLKNISRFLESVLQRYRQESMVKSRPLRVLYVEHNAFDIDLTQKHLAQFAPHIHLKVAPNAEKLIDLFPDRGQAKTVCDVLLLDYKLPGFNALDALKILRFQRKVDVPAVLVTGQGSEQIAMQAIHLGFDGYLIKQPGYLYLLPSALESAFYRSELTREHVELKAGRQFYEELVTRIPVGVYRLRALPNDILIFDYASPRFFETFGLPPDSSLSAASAAFSLAQADDLAELLRCINASRRSLEPMEWEGRFLIDGEMRWLRIESTSTQLGNDDVVSEGIVKDITKHPQMKL